jgi:hypothetical protein
MRNGVSTDCSFSTVIVSHVHTHHFSAGIVRQNQFAARRANGTNFDLKPNLAVDFFGARIGKAQPRNICHHTLPRRNESSNHQNDERNKTFCVILHGLTGLI